MNGGWGMSGGGMYLPFHCDCGLKCCAQDCQMTHYFDWNFHKWFNFVNIFLFFFDSSGRGQMTRYRYHPGSEPQVWPVSSCPELLKEKGGCIHLVCYQLYCQLADVSPPITLFLQLQPAPPPPPTHSIQYRHVLELNVYHICRKRKEWYVPSKRT